MPTTLRPISYPANQLFAGTYFQQTLIFDGPDPLQGIACGSDGYLQPFSLPPGLEFDPTTRILFGTPTHPAGTYDTFTAIFRSIGLDTDTCNIETVFEVFSLDLVRQPSNTLYRPCPPATPGIQRLAYIPLQDFEPIAFAISDGLKPHLHTIQFPLPFITIPTDKPEYTCTPKETPAGIIHAISVKAPIGQDSPLRRAQWLQLHRTQVIALIVDSFGFAQILGTPDHPLLLTLDRTLNQAQNTITLTLSGATPQPPYQYLEA